MKKKNEEEAENGKKQGEQASFFCHRGDLNGNVDSDEDIECIALVKFQQWSVRRTG